MREKPILRKSRKGPGGELSLEVIYRGRRVFSDNGKWLFPLFELEKFLDASELPRSELTVRDKVVGRAAA